MLRLFTKTLDKNKIKNQILLREIIIYNYLQLDSHIVMSTRHCTVNCY